MQCNSLVGNLVLSHMNRSVYRIKVDLLGRLVRWSGRLRNKDAKLRKVPTCAYGDNARDVLILIWVKTSLHQAVGREKSQPQGAHLISPRPHACPGGFIPCIRSVALLSLSLSPFAADGDTEGSACGSAGRGNGAPPASSPAETTPARWGLLGSSSSSSRPSPDPCPLSLPRVL
jgi:hypothetical protein